MFAVTVFSNLLNDAIGMTGELVTGDGNRPALMVICMAADSGDTFPATSDTIAVSVHGPLSIAAILQLFIVDDAVKEHEALVFRALVPLMVTMSPSMIPATEMTGVAVVVVEPVVVALVGGALAKGASVSTVIARAGEGTEVLFAASVRVNVTVHVPSVSTGSVHDRMADENVKAH